MSINRTGTGAWKNLRATMIAEAQARGQTTCLVCRAWLDYDHAGLPNSPEVDHITPHALGGTDTPANLRVVCRTCNRSMGARMTRRPRTPPARAKQPPTAAPW